MISAILQPRCSILVAFASVAACSSSDPITVAVVDSGFDPSAPVLEGMVVGRYSEVCSPSDLVPTQPTDLSATELKEALLNEFAEPEDCELIDGISPTKLDTSAIDPYREQWNQVFLEKKDVVESGLSFPQVVEIQATFAGQFHGTQVASIVAHDNPDVELVLIETVLLGSFDEIVDECITQEMIDRWTEVLVDPDVLAAAASQPRSKAQQRHQELVATHNIRIQNESFGGPTADQLQQVFENAGCGVLEFEQLLVSLYEMNKTVAQAETEPPTFVTIAAAGNEDTELVSGVEIVDCTNPSRARLMIGSHDFRGQLSGFTNFGQCVFGYTHGESLITGLPSGFVIAADGTSFAAPLLVRMMTELDQSLFDDTDIVVDELGTMLDPSDNFVFADPPLELIWARDTPEIEQFRLKAPKPRIDHRWWRRVRR